MQKTNRRKFIQTTLVAASAPFASAMALQAGGMADSDEEGFTCLFQGDSITDGNRTHNNDWNHVLGHGYAYLLASRLWFNHPNKKLHFFNRGVSGNKVSDLQARWQQDTLDIKPNLLSILVGINEVDAYVGGNKDFSAEQYQTAYTALLKQTTEQLPGVQLVICEPFILPVGRVKDKLDAYNTEIIKRQAIAKALATQFGAIYIELQSAFNKALEKAPADFWIWDGIHPMPASHELIAQTWLAGVNKKLKIFR